MLHFICVQKIKTAVKHPIEFSTFILFSSQFTPYWCRLIDTFSCICNLAGSLPQRILPWPCLLHLRIYLQRRPYIHPCIHLSCWQFAIAHSALALPTSLTHLSSTQALHTSLHSPFSIKHFLTFIFSAHEHLNADVCATSTRAKKRVKIVNLIFSI